MMCLTTANILLENVNHLIPPKRFHVSQQWGRVWEFLNVLQTEVYLSCASDSQKVKNGIRGASKNHHNADCVFQTLNGEKMGLSISSTLIHTSATSKMSFGVYCLSSIRLCYLSSYDVPRLQIELEQPQYGSPSTSALLALLVWFCRVAAWIRRRHACNEGKTNLLQKQAGCKKEAEHHKTANKDELH